MEDTIAEIQNPDLEQLRLNKESGFNYRKRREDEWLENYMLYRGKVNVNRLTQRQTVHVPLMKQTVKSIMKDVDDMPVLYFENIDNDQQKEMFKNKYWEWTVEQNRMEIQDIVDKKQVIMFGRSFDQWQIADGRVQMSVQDPQDILVSRYTDPTNINTSRFLIHTHIFRSLSELENNPNYDKSAVEQLKTWYGTEQGLIKVSENAEMQAKKNEKMEEMGVPDVDAPSLGEPIFEISLHFFWKQHNEHGEENIYLQVEAEDQVILQEAWQEDIIGVTADNFWRYNYTYSSWADDVERQDFWTDGVADIVRPENKILNAWFSQLVENRTLRNFGMHYYDTTANEGNWSPNTYNPQPWGWYPVPGKPSDVMQKVDIPELSESLDEMQFIISMAEKATGATPTQQGNISERQVTLGEVQLALGEAKERIKGMSKFYTEAWKRRGVLFQKLIEAAGDKLDAVKLQAKGRNSNDIYEREVTANDWMSKSGYICKVWSQDEKDQKDTNSLQKLNAAIQLIPGNNKLMEIYKRKLLEFSDLSPDEINAVMVEERDKVNTNLLGGQDGQTVQGTQPVVPAPQPNPVA